MKGDSELVHFANGITTFLIFFHPTENREERVRQYLEDHPHLEIPHEDAYVRMLESLDHERYWR